MRTTTIPRWLSCALIGFLLPAAIGLPTLGRVEASSEGAYVWIEEDNTCDDPARAGSPNLPLVIDRRPASVRYSSAALAAGKSGYALIELYVDDTGKAHSGVILEETPGRDFGRTTLESAASGYTFAQQRPGSYCLGVSFEARGSSIPPAEDSDLKMAPHPAAADPVPQLPDAAFAAKAECKVELAIGIEADGSTPFAMVISEDPRLLGCGSAAAQAVRAWKFPDGTEPGRYRLKLRIKS